MAPQGTHPETLCPPRVHGVILHPPFIFMLNSQNCVRHVFGRTKINISIATCVRPMRDSRLTPSNPRGGRKELWTRRCWQHWCLQRSGSGADVISLRFEYLLRGICICLISHLDARSRQRVIMWETITYFLLPVGRARPGCQGHTNTN